MLMKKMIRGMVGLLTVGVMSAGGISQSDGAPYREIVIAADAPATVKLAAEELRKYVKAVCGAELPIINNGVGTGDAPRIYVGNSPGLQKNGITLDGLKPEGFRIVAKPGVLAIAGRDYSGPVITGFRHPWRECDIWSQKLQLDAFGENGTLSGVYAFLEKYGGVRWYMPGELGAVITPQQTILIPEVTLEDAPAVNYRYPLFCLFGQLFSQEVDGPLWFKRMGFGGIAPVQIMHDFELFLKYKDTHPEYFALVDGERDFGSKCALSAGGHLCLTNPDVIKQWAADIGEYFDKHPEQQTFALMPMDGLTRICGCPKCQAEINKEGPDTGRFSNHIWGFINKVAAEVALKYPDKMIGCCAYEKYFEPPTAFAKLHPNVAVMLCYQRGLMVLPEYRSNIRHQLEAWSNKAGKVYIWNWYLDTLSPWRGLPVVYTRAINDDLKFLAQLKNYGGEFIQAENGADEGHPFQMKHPGMQHLNLYVTGKLFWHPERDVNMLLDEYFRLFYGPAETEMRDFWTTAEKARIDAGAKVGGKDRELVPEDVFSPAILKHLDECLEQAQSKTSPDSVYRQRVDLIAREFAPGRSSLTQLAKNGKQSADVFKVSAPDALGLGNPLRFVSKNGEAAPVATWLYAGWDAKNLYLKFICYDPVMKKLKAAGQTRDDDRIVDDDTIEIFISPDPKNPESCFQFVINAKGAILDIQHGFGGTMAKSWNGKISTAVEIEANRWLLKVTIPFSELGVNAAASGMKFGVNFYRRWVCDQKSPSYSCWSPTLDARNYTPHRFGTMIFKDGP